MGAEQIGFIAIIPKKIDKKALRKARRRCDTVYRNLCALSQAASAVATALGPSVTLETRLTHMEKKPSLRKLCAFAGREMLESIFDGTFQMPMSPAETFSNLSEIAMYRDVAVRSHVASLPDHLIVFAGEMTWGDPPEGTGYRTLEALETYGVTYMLGFL